MGHLLQRFWGYLVLGLALLGWATHLLGAAVILILSLLALIYFLVQAPGWCGAEIRNGGHCRENSHGFLMGCYRRQHKWQRLRNIFFTRKWRDTFHTLLSGPGDKLATAGGLASIISLFIALVAL